MKRIKIDLKIGFEDLAIGARDTVTTQYLGKYKSVFKGRGLEFDSYRDFTPDDDASLIDWKASAKGGHLMIKQYVEERNLNVFFLMDVSNSMILSSQPILKCEYAAELISSLAFSVLNSGDNVGYALFNDRVIEYRPFTRGMETYSELIETLSKSTNYGGGFNLHLAVEHMIEFIPQGSVVFLITDFIGLNHGWENAIRLAAHKFSLIGIGIRDPIDRRIPEGVGQIAVADPFSEETMLIDPNMIKPYYEKDVQMYEELVSSVFLDNGAELVFLETHEDFIGKIMELFKQREAKWK